MNAGLIDANLGADLFKKRIAMPGQGKRGSWRANSRANIEDDEMKALKRLTRYYFTLKPSDIKTALQCGELKEVKCNEL